MGASSSRLTILAAVAGMASAFMPAQVSRTWTNKALAAPKSSSAVRSANRAERLRAMQLSACGCTAGACECGRMSDGCGCVGPCSHNKAKACGCVGACSHAKSCGCVGACSHSKACGCAGACSHMACGCAGVCIC
mmetsp:Transcript_14325/g.21571  ORF Transcript_14325/g.21571 Transcript_14325/m.21571 type:complete len:135 (-) Transcript_14325:229-633(-)